LEKAHEKYMSEMSEYREGLRDGEFIFSIYLGKISGRHNISPLQRLLKEIYRYLLSNRFKISHR
jgi:hypothetical protein